MSKDPFSTIAKIAVWFLLGLTLATLPANCRRNDRLDALEKRLAEKDAAAKPKSEKLYVVAEPEDPVPVPGAVISINMVEEKPDEVYRDITVVTSIVHAPGTGCRLSHLREEITALEIRGRYVLVQYERRGTTEEIESWRKKWFYRTDPPFCENGDIGVMSFEDFERYRYGAETDVIVQREQREELARIHMLFPELLATPAEGP
ncbi:MAG: hypothetical protein WC866_04790 [Patescibacteria group bacterium]